MIRIVIEAGTVREALEQARDLWTGQTEMRIFKTEEEAKTHMTEHIEPVVGSIEQISIDGTNEVGKFPPQATTVTDTPPVAMEPPTIPAIDTLPKAPPPPTATPAPDVDARGIPWDGRIHAGNKAQTKDKSWKRRRGVSVEEVQRIEAELRPAPVEPNHTLGVATGPATLDFQPTPPPPPGPPAAAPGTEPPLATLDQVSREAAKRNLGINALNALAAEVTNGQVGQVALLRDKPAYVQAVYDKVRRQPLAV
jgi:hypothetical protein